MYVCLSQLQQMFAPSRKPSTSSRKEIHLNASSEQLQTGSATLRLENKSVVLFFSRNILLSLVHILKSQIILLTFDVIWSLKGAQGLQNLSYVFCALFFFYKQMRKQVHRDQITQALSSKSVMELDFRSHIAFPF